MRAAAVLLVVLLLAPTLARSEPSPQDPVARALGYLASKWPLEGRDAANTVEALAEAGIDPKEWPTPGDNVFERLAPYAGRDGDYYAQLRVAHAAAVAGYDPHEINGVDYVALVRAGHTGGQSGSATFINDDAWAILALRAAGVPKDDAQIHDSVRTLRATQLPDGGWSFQVPSLKSQTDTTGAVLAALRAAGEPMSDFAAAKGFLDTTYDPASGGHIDNSGIPANTQSTIWAIHGYAALGVAPRVASLAYAAGRQRADGGFGDAFATEEAVVFLAGARYPLASYAPLAPPAPVVAARDAIALSVPAPFTTGTWRFDDAILRGSAPERSFASSGTYRYHLLAEGPGLRARIEGNVTVTSARPIVARLPAEIDAPRHVPLALDLRASRDPDGRVVRHEIDWGDGNVTDATPHAFDFPGDRTITVRAQDDAGGWSDPARIVAHVRNRAPVLDPLPDRMIADRAHTLTFAPTATDADGDLLEISWRLGLRTGRGAVAWTPDALGNATLAIEARDAFGGVAWANVSIEVVNLAPLLANVTIPPRATGGEVFALAASATDADGPPPNVTWRAANLTATGARAELALSPGTWRVDVEALDADGAIVRAEGSIEVVARDAPTPAAPRVVPTIRDVNASFAGGVFVVRGSVEPQDARAVLRWTSDSGDGEVAWSADGVEVPLPGATRVEATLVVTADELVASLTVGPFFAAPAARVAVLESPREIIPQNVSRDEPLERASEPAPSALSPEPPAELTPQETARRPVPGGAVWAVLACCVVAALLARARRGRR